MVILLTPQCTSYLVKAGTSTYFDKLSTSRSVTNG